MLMDESLEIILRILPLIVGPILGYLLFLGFKPYIFRGRDVPYDATITKVEINPANSKKVIVEYEFHAKDKLCSNSHEETVKSPTQFMVGAKYRVYSNDTGEYYPITDKDRKLASGIFIGILAFCTTGFLLMSVNMLITNWGI